MKFKQAVEYVLLDEGGYVNHKNDRGGETKYGISKRSYPGLDIKNLTKGDARRIYFDDFWSEGGVDRIPERLRYMFFDMCINHGPHGATRILQRSALVEDDGIIGTNTLKALERLKLTDLKEARDEYFKSIVTRNSSQSVFLNGWLRRSKKVYDRSRNNN